MLTHILTFCFFQQHSLNIILKQQKIIKNRIFESLDKLSNTALYAYIFLIGPIHKKKTIIDDRCMKAIERLKRVENTESYGFLLCWLKCFFLRFNSA